ncbi:MAG: LysR substrate-binding domain-containing protein [Pararhizobium sp.]
MTLEQLRIFVAVAEREHVTRAAEALHLTQSATSAAVAALENRYATALFHRVGRRIELTAAGRAFLVEARAVLARAASAESVLADLAGLKRGTLRLAASQTVGNYWLPPRMARFHAAYPEIALPFTIGNTEQAAHRVLDGLADVGFVEGGIDDPSLATEDVAEDRLVLIVAAGHPWADASSVDWSDLAGGRFVLREAGSGTRAMLEAALREHGLAAADLAVAMELPSNEAVIAAVCAGAGATVVSQVAAAAALAVGAAREVALDLPARRFTLVRHRERHASAAETAFRAMLG